MLITDSSNYDLPRNLRFACLRHRVSEVTQSWRRSEPSFTYHQTVTSSPRNKTNRRFLPTRSWSNGPQRRNQTQRRRRRLHRRHRGSEIKLSEGWEYNSETTRLNRATSTDFESGSRQPQDECESHHVALKATDKKKNLLIHRNVAL